MTEHSADIRPSYPSDDQIAYLPWFANRFSSVFVALSPFAHAAPASSLQHTPTCIRWRDIAVGCQFPSVALVNRALRMTGSKRITRSLSNGAETKTLLKYCERNAIEPPEEGCVSPLLQIEIADFLRRSGAHKVSIASHFGGSLELIAASEFDGPSLINSPDILAGDRSFYMSIYTDYHYLLICQSAVSRKAVDPSTIFEGFYATALTSDFWGIGDL